MTPLCHIDDIAPGTSKGVQLLDRAILLVRRDNSLYAYLNRCPHRGIPLEWQPDQFLDLSGRYIQCATHGALFKVEDGYCIQGPCQGRQLEPAAIRVDEQGDVFLI